MARRIRKKVKVPLFGQPAARVAVIEDGATQGATIGTDLYFEDGSVATIEALRALFATTTTSTSSSLGTLSATLWRLIREVPIYTVSPTSPNWEYTLDGAAIGSVGYAAVADGIAAGSLAGDLVLAPVNGRVYVPQVGALDGLVIDADSTNSPAIAFERDSAGVVGRIGVAGAADGVGTGSVAGDLVLAPTAGSVFIPQVTTTPALVIESTSTNSPLLRFDRAGSAVASFGVAGAAEGLAANTLVGDLVLAPVDGRVFIPVTTGNTALFIDGDVGDTTTPMIMLDNTGAASDRRILRIRETDTLDRGFNFDGILSGDNTNNALVWGSDFVGSIARIFKFWADGRVGFGNEAFMFTPATASTDVVISSIGDVTLTLAADTDNVTETDNPTLKLTQDSGQTFANLGLAGQAGVDSTGQTFTGMLNNGLAIRAESSASSGIGLGVGSAVAFLITATNENTFLTAGRFLDATLALEIEAAAPVFLIDETDAAANERQWRWRSVAGVLRLDTYTDAGALGANAIAIDRTGTVVAEIELNATTFDFNGALDLSGNATIGGTAISLASGTTITTAGTLTLSGTGETLATFADDGAVTLYFDNTARVATSSTGFDVLAGLLLTVASAAGTAGLRLPHGTAPTSPTDGDLWTTSAGLFVRVSGTTIGPLGGAAAGDVFGGYVDDDGTALDVPTGWSSAYSAPTFTVTHNLGHTNYVVTLTTVDGTAHANAQIVTMGSNDFTYECFNDENGNIAVPVTFALILT